MCPPELRQALSKADSNDASSSTHRPILAENRYHIYEGKGTGNAINLQILNIQLQLQFIRSLIPFQLLHVMYGYFWSRASLGF